MKRFTAPIYKIGINPVVDPPDKVVQAIFAEASRTKGPIPVRGKLNGTDFVQTLVKFRGAWRLYINGPMLNDSGLSVGDTATVDIEFDPRPREVAMPKKFADALRNDGTARVEFDKLTPSRQKEILRYLGSLKTEASIERNVERVILHLRNEPTDAQHALMRRSKTAK